MPGVNTRGGRRSCECAVVLIKRAEEETVGKMSCEAESVRAEAL